MTLENNASYPCPVCSCNDTGLLELIPNYPAIIFPVDAGIDVDTKDLEIHQCRQCTHVFQTNVDADFNALLYTKYYKYYPYGNAEFFMKHYREPFERIFSGFVASRASGDLLEIGVSDPKQLDYFNNFDFDTIGLTPEDIKHPSIISSFYEDHKFDNKFNAIVSRFNLEHIVDLDIFMRKINDDLNDNGIFIAQVPNVESYICENILNLYAHEHIQYFNKKSLTTLFEAHGFSVEAAYNYKSPSLIIVGVKNVDKEQRNIENYAKDTKEIKRDIKSLVEKYFSCSQKIVFYGASLSLNGLLYGGDNFISENADNIIILDDNPIITEKNIPSLNIPIQLYHPDLIAEGDVIILTLNSVYHHTVIEKMKRDGISNDVYGINQYGLEKISL